MTIENARKTAECAADLIQRLVWLSCIEQHASALTRAQWAALRFFGRATKSSRTLTGFADFRATTYGSASQTLKAMVANGLLTKTVSCSDGRSIEFDLTEKGRFMLESDPTGQLVAAIAELPDGELAQLKDRLETVHAGICTQSDRPEIGTCSTCGALKDTFEPDTDGRAYFCSRAKTDVCANDFDRLCIRHVPRAPDCGS